MTIIQFLMDRSRFARPSNPYRSFRLEQCGLWGEGLVDEPLSAIWRPTAWNEVDDDELVFLIPSLVQAHRLGRADPTDGPAARIKSALLGEVAGLSRRLAHGSNDVSAREEALHCDLSSVVASLTQAELLDATTGSRDRASTFDALPARSDDAAYEFDVIGCLDRFYADALPATGSATRSMGTPYTLADCLICSIHTGVNAAYVWDRFDWAHELLTTGAWLGHLARGRRALLPLAVADCLLEYLTPRPQSLQSDEVEVSISILRNYAECCVGEARLLAKSRSVLKKGFSTVVKPHKTRALKKPALRYNDRAMQH